MQDFLITHLVPCLGLFFQHIVFFFLDNIKSLYTISLSFLPENVILLGYFFSRKGPGLFYGSSGVAWVGRKGHTFLKIDFILKKAESTDQSLTN